MLALFIIAASLGQVASSSSSVPLPDLIPPGQGALPLPSEAPDVTTKEEGLGPEFTNPDQTGVRSIGAIKIDGYLRVIAEAVENDRNNPFIGRNDGFRLGNARFAITAGDENLHGFISVDGAFGEAQGFNNPNSRFTVQPRDAFLYYHVSDYADLRLGRFKVPYDLGELEAVANRVFIDQPLESRGVIASQGFQVFGMTQGRQLGIMLSRSKLGLGLKNFDIGYAVALTNGRAFEFTLNDNDRPAGFARLSFLIGPWVTLNLAGFTDERTSGELPDLFDEEARGIETSMNFTLENLRLEAQLLYQDIAFATTGLPNQKAIGWHAQAAYHFWQVAAAYRISAYDPNLDDLEDFDAVMEHSLGLSYDSTVYPIRFLLNGTLALEQAGRHIDNDRIAFLVQYAF